MKRTREWIGVMALLGVVAAPAWAQQAPAPAAAPATPGATIPAPEATKPKAATAHRVTGAVKSASADGLVVLVGKAKKEETFTFDKDTKVTKAGKAIQPGDLTANEWIRVTYVESDGKMVAKAVTVRTPRIAAKPATQAQPQTQPKTP